MYIGRNGAIDFTSSDGIVSASKSTPVDTTMQSLSVARANASVKWASFKQNKRLSFKPVIIRINVDFIPRLHQISWWYHMQHSALLQIHNYCTVQVSKMRVYFAICDHHESFEQRNCHCFDCHGLLTVYREWYKRHLIRRLVARLSCSLFVKSFMKDNRHLADFLLVCKQLRFLSTVCLIN